MISVLIPSRGNPLGLAHALHSLESRKTGEVEYVLRLDHDADDLHDCVAAIKSYRTVTLIGPRRNGFDSIHDFLWEAFCVSTGDVLVPWNDDMLMLTDGWDDTIEAAMDADRPHVRHIQPKQHWPWSMPVVNRPLLELFGHFSLHACYDSWFHAVALHPSKGKKLLYAQEKIPVNVSHDRGKKAMTYPSWPGPNAAKLLADCERYAAARSAA